MTQARGSQHEDPARGMEHGTTDGFDSRPGRRLGDYGDEALMLRARSGDKEAFEVLVSRHAETILALCSRCLADEAGAKSAAEEAFLALWTARDRYQPESSVKGFLAGLARGAVRRRVGGHAASAASPAAGATRQGLAPSPSPLCSALGRLSVEDREVLATRYGMRLGYEEIARATGRPAATVRARAFEALRTMRSLMNDTRPPAASREEA